MSGESGSALAPFRVPDLPSPCTCRVHTCHENTAEDPRSLNMARNLCCDPDVLSLACLSRWLVRWTLRVSPTGWDPERPPVQLGTGYRKVTGPEGHLACQGELPLVSWPATMARACSSSDCSHSLLTLPSWPQAKAGKFLSYRLGAGGLGPR